MKTFKEFCEVCGDLMEQIPPMNPNEYTTQISRSSARWKGQQIRHSHQELMQKANKEQSAKQARMKQIMSR